MNHQSSFDAGHRMLGADALGRTRGMAWGGRWEGGSCLGTHVRVKDFKIEKKIKNKRKKKESCGTYTQWSITQPLK